jgi:hypothetical protein
LAKITRAVPQQLADGIRNAAPEFLYLKADSNVDLRGRQHLVRRNGDTLERLTAEQTEYATEHPLAVTERNAVVYS